MDSSAVEEEEQDEEAEALSTARPLRFVYRSFVGSAQPSLGSEGSKDACEGCLFLLGM